MQIKNGSLLIFRLFGVNVFINWTWLIGAVYLINRNQNLDAVAGRPHPLSFYILLYLCLFLIVLIHEFGHALACKSVGGIADRIVLSPIGGIAFVQPPQRPGAYLWSIAAGPLVNVILLPLTAGPAILVNVLRPGGGFGPEFLTVLAVMNAGLLIFNMLPFYPLDGGQILRALLWFPFGRANSLIIAAILGIAGSGLLVLLAIVTGGILLGIIIALMVMQSVFALRMGITLRRVEGAPRHPDPVCPSCHENPPAGDFWTCPCGMRFDTFITGAQCPRCGRAFESTSCPLCNQSAPLPLWYSTRGFSIVAQPPAPPPATA